MKESTFPIRHTAHRRLHMAASFYSETTKLYTVWVVVLFIKYVDLKLDIDSLSLLKVYFYKKVLVSFYSQLVVSHSCHFTWLVFRIIKFSVPFLLDIFLFQLSVRLSLILWSTLSQHRPVTLKNKLKRKIKLLLAVHQIIKTACVAVGAEKNVSSIIQPFSQVGKRGDNVSDWSVPNWKSIYTRGICQRACDSRKSTVPDDITDGWLPLTCIRYRVLMLWMLAHCHGLMTHLSGTVPLLILLATHVLFQVCQEC